MNCTPAYYPIGAWPGYQKGRLFKYPLFQREKMSRYQCQILVGRSRTLLNYTNLNFLVSSMFLRLLGLSQLYIALIGLLIFEWNELRFYCTRYTYNKFILSFVVGKNDRTRFNCIAIETLLFHFCNDIALIKKILKKFCQIIHCCVTTSFIHSFCVVSDWFAARPR